MYTGSISLDAHVDAKLLPGILASSLRAVRAKNVVELADRVTFTGGVFRFVSNWNVLVPFTNGELVINTTARRLEYRVSFAQVVGFLILFTIAASVFMLVGRFPMPMIPVVLAAIWLWIAAGMSLLE